MTLFTNLMRELITHIRKHPMRLDITIAILLPLLFLGVVYYAQRWSEIDTDVVFIALVPVLIILIVSGKLLLNEIQTPAGVKILFNQRLKEADSSLIRAPPIADGMVEANEFNGTSNATEIIERIQDKNTHILSFELERDEPYDEKIVSACMNAIMSDPEMTVRYIHFSDKKDRFEGMLRISDCFQNRIIISVLSPTELKWDGLTEDINDGSVLQYPGTVTEDGSISVRSPIRKALLKMSECDRDWLPVLNGGRLTGVVSEDQLLRDIILTWMDGQEKTRTASRETSNPAISNEIDSKAV